MARNSYLSTGFLIIFFGFLFLLDAYGFEQKNKFGRELTLSKIGVEKQANTTMMPNLDRKITRIPASVSEEDEHKVAPTVYQEGKVQAAIFVGCRDKSGNYVGPDHPFYTDCLEAAQITEEHTPFTRVETESINAQIMFSF